jgi:Glycosyltransferase family 87
MPSPAPDRDRRSLLPAAACLPILLFFGWIMVQRLETCPKGIRTDFVQEWTSARNYWTGRPIYLPLSESFPAYFGPKAGTDLKVNAHPPVAVLVALPFGLIEYRSAWLTWNLLSFALLGLTLWLLMRRDGLGYAAADVIPVTALLLAGNPLPQQVIEGQMNLVLLALTVGAWAADRQGRQSLAGCLVGLAAAVKFYPAFLVVYFLAARRWRAVVASGITFGSASLLAAIVFGPDIFVVYVRDVMPAFAHWGNNIANTSLPGLWSTVFVGMRNLSGPLIAAPHLVGAFKVASGLCLAALCGWKTFKANDEAGRDIAFAACTVGMLLASPITWGHSFVILLAPVLILWRQTTQTHLRLILAALVALLWLVRPGWIWNPLVPGFEEFALGIAPAGYQISPFYAITVLSYLTYALLALFLLAICVRAPRPTEIVYRS